MKFTITDKNLFKQQVLQWANQFNICSIFDSNYYKDPYSQFDMLIAAGAHQELSCNVGNAFNELKAFRKGNSGWLIGGLGYDLKNEIEDLVSSNPDEMQFPDLFFFAPQHLLFLKEHSLEIKSPNAEQIFKEITTIVLKNRSPIAPIDINSRFSKSDYINTINKIKDQIATGNIYETNFCMEFYKKDIVIEPLEIYNHLNTISPTPFSSYFKWHDKSAISASPERFLSKKGKKLISQPIKGTAKRSKDLAEDEQIKYSLANHPKEQQENVMIVDLVRNDLTRSAKKGTVQVEELFGIYSFKQVHQMISTVVCQVKDDLDVVDIIKNTFPMGSMTGAPKIKAMQLMEQFELSKRGLYSGALGYITPDDDFDFNVVIRTILYNKSSKYLSFHAGSAITFLADADKEYEECLLKISAMLQSLNAKLVH